MSKTYDFWMRATFKIKWTTTCLFVFLQACSHVPVNHENAVINKGVDKYKYEIELTVDQWPSTNSGNPIDMLFHTKITTHYYFYLNDIDGVFTPDKFVLTAHKKEVEWPDVQENIKGKITILENRLIIDLQLPIYKGDTIISYENSKLNGVYLLSRNLD